MLWCLKHLPLFFEFSISLKIRQLECTYGSVRCVKKSHDYKKSPLCDSLFSPNRTPLSVFIGSYQLAPDLVPLFSRLSWLQDSGTPKNLKIKDLWNWLSLLYEIARNGVTKTGENFTRAFGLRILILLFQRFYFVGFQLLKKDVIIGHIKINPGYLKVIVHVEFNRSKIKPCMLVLFSSPGHPGRFS